MAGYDDTHMMLRDDFYGKMAVEYFDIGVRLYGSDKAFLYFGTCIVFVVQNAEFGVTAFFMEVEVSLIILVEVHSPVYQFFDLSGGLAHHFLHGGAVTDPVACNHGVFNVLVEVIYQCIGY